MLRLSEIVIVEGRNDSAAVRRAADCETIETHGYGISPETWARIDRAYKSTGIIIFTDPDEAGRKIRDRIKERYPGAGEAFLTLPLASKDGNIGVETAAPRDIEAALAKVCRPLREKREEFSMRDMAAHGLTGAGSRKRREEAGRLLGIGYGNARRFLDRLNNYGITREEFNAKIPE